MAVLNITSENYEKEVVGSKLPVLLDFWAPWCKYCRRIAPVVERVAQEYEGKVVVAQCNVDDAPALAQQFKVDIIPSLFLIKNGVPGEDFAYSSTSRAAHVLPTPGGPQKIIEEM